MERIGGLNVHVFNYIHNRLEELGFERNDIEDFNELGLTYYKRNNKNIFLKSYDFIPSLESIQNDSLNLRETLISLNMNAWESYFIISFDIDDSTTNLANDFNYLIERDNNSLRKYVIQVESDLNRIPFLDHTKRIDMSIDGTTTSTELGKNKVIDKMIELFKEQDGLQKKLKDKEIENVVRTLLKGVNN